MTPTATGTCTLCGHQTTKGAMSRHLDACLARHEPDSGPIQKWLRLRVEGGGPYWLDLEAHANATLSDLDGFLRSTWLECCGHMSAFLAPGGRAEHSMHKTLLAVFAQRGDEVGYEYDFGSTTALRLRSAGGTCEHRGGRTRVRLLARNVAPSFTCSECKQPATIICPFVYDEEEPFFCPEHSEAHRCDGPECHLPVVNSPRMGVCGYTG